MRGRTRSGLIFVGLLSAVLLGGTRVGWRVLAPALLSVVDHSEARDDCDDWLGQLAAVARGRADPGSDRCRADVLGGSRTAVLLERIARNPDRKPSARSAALRVLAAGRSEPIQVGIDLLDSPAEAPRTRRAMLRALASGPGGVAWIESPVRWPLHGLHDSSILLLAAEGEADTDAADAWASLGEFAEEPDRVAALTILGTTDTDLRRLAARVGAGQAPLGVPLTWHAALSAHPCDPDCDALIAALLRVEVGRRSAIEALPAPTLPGDDELLDLLYGPDRTEHVRRELGAVLDWVAADPQRAAERALAAAATPGARPPTIAELQARAGDLHATLRDGTGPPGAVAATLSLVGEAAGRAQVWVDPTGTTIELAEREVHVSACGVATQVEFLPVGATLVPTPSVGALALVEAGGRALREGEPTHAAELASAARSRWADAPGLAQLEASSMAALAAGAPGLRDGRDSTPPEPAQDAAGRRGWRHPAGLHVAIGLGRRFPVPGDLEGGQRRAKTVAAIRSATTDPRTLSLAAWWAAAYGDLDLARLLIPGPVPGPFEDLRVATLLFLDEPTTPLGPLSRVLVNQAPGEVDCPPPFSPWPRLPAPTPSR